MDTVQILLITFGAGGLLMLLALAFGGPSPAKEGARRLQSVRFRHSESATDKVEAQMRRALAQRRPMLSNDGSPRSQLEMLALRLHRAGKTWTVQQYLQASGGLGRADGGGIAAPLAQDRLADARADGGAAGGGGRAAYGGGLSDP